MTVQNNYNLILKIDFFILTHKYDINCHIKKILIINFLSALTKIRRAFI